MSQKVSVPKFGILVTGIFMEAGERVKKSDDMVEPFIIVYVNMEAIRVRAVPPEVIKEFGQGQVVSVYVTLSAFKDTTYFTFRELAAV